MRYEVKADMNSLAEAMDFIRKGLLKYRAKHADETRLSLISEELLVKCIELAEPGETIRLEVVSVLSRIMVRISCPGQELTIQPENVGLQLDENDDPEAERVIRDMLLNSYGRNIRHKYSRGVNEIEITADAKKLSNTTSIIIMAVLGVVLGGLLKLAPTAVADFINTNILTVISNMIITALKMLVVPLVFFTIAGCVARMDDLRVFGRIGVKVFAIYTVTSILAISLACLVYYILPLGDPKMAQALSMEAVEAGDFSLRDTVINIVPGNFLGAFTAGNMLQILFLAIIMGIAAVRLKSNNSVRNFLDSANDIFLEAVNIVIRFMGVALFCSMATLVYTMGASSMAQLAGLTAMVWVGDALMMFVVYSILLVVFGRINPIHFYKTLAPTLLMGIAAMSSAAIIPNTMGACKKLGVSPKVYSFSIPLGSTVNMDASCIFMTLSVLFTMKSFGIAITPTAVLPALFMLLVMSIGSPGVVGGSLASLSIILPMVGIPATAVSVLSVVYSVIIYIQLPCNVSGDAAVTAVVARREGLYNPPQ